MRTLPQLSTMLLAAAALCVAVVLAVIAAALLAHLAEERDIGSRIRVVLRPVERVGPVASGRSRGFAALRPFQRVGEFLRDSTIISITEVAGFQRSMAMAGLDPKRAVPIFLGIKAAVLFALPAAAAAVAMAMEFDRIDLGKAVVGALVGAVVGPNWIVGKMRKGFQEKLRRGLPDALDLMVVAAEAGLGLETAVDRVAREMALPNRAISMELNIFVQELRLLPDRRTALERLADRNEVEGFKRMGATLAQTLRYGTPLAQALRVLASDMRQERMLRIEEKAMRLPALLIGPLILFILPALFIALIGPSVLELGKSFGGSP